jgi:L-threonylcarbamoyladenylate synthase
MDGVNFFIDIIKIMDLMLISLSFIIMINRDEIDLAVKLLKQGRLIVFPTETVYALAGDARNLSALKQIFKLKHRPLNQALSVLLAEHQSLDAWATNVSPLARKLAQHFWPGPLTLILNKHESVLSELCAGQAKIGLRVPDHPVAQALLKAFAGGLAAPSANRSAHLSPTQVEHVRQEFADKLALIIEGGPCAVGIESTVLDVTTKIPRVLRVGAISLEQISQFTPYELIKSVPKLTQLAKPLLQQIAIGQLAPMVRKYLHQGKTLTVLGLRSPNMSHESLIWITMPNEAAKYGQVLYQYLHDAEQRASDKILVESVPKHAAWEGIQFLLDRQSFQG